MNITVEIKAPELAEAILNLASALAIGKNSQNPTLMQAPAPIPAITPVPVAAAPAPAPAPATMVAPAAAPIPAAVPTTDPLTGQLAQAAVVPTTAPTYTMDQLAQAATQLIDSGHREQVVALLATFGVQALTALPKEQYGNFATQLRTMGAKI